ncbi:MAG: NmrA/HSCARG family protein [Chloroflexota bacterium]
MNDDSTTILVTGSTGQQGGAVARHLLARGRKVRALTRDTSKPAAQALAAAGAEVVQGDLEDRASLDRALQGVHGVFSVQNFFEAGPEGETRQGKLLADAGKAAGVRHFVYSSVGGADRESRIPHFESKAEIERHVKALGVPYTIVQPVYFMDNFNTYAAPTPGDDGTLQLAMALPADRTLQLIATDDIGAIVALVFERPQEFLGRSIELAGDELTIPQVAEAMSRATGKTIRFVPLPLEVVRGFSEDLALMFQWFTDKGYQADIPSLRTLYPGLTDFTTWLGKNGWTPSKEFAAPQYA